MEWLRRRIIKWLGIVPKDVYYVYGCAFHGDFGKKGKEIEICMNKASKVIKKKAKEVF